MLGSEKTQAEGDKAVGAISVVQRIYAEARERVLKYSRPRFKKDYVCTVMDADPVL